MTNNRVRSSVWVWNSTIITLLTCFYHSFVFALPQDVVVSTPQGQPLTIDLTPMLVGMTADSITVPATTAMGSSSAQVVSSGGVIVTAQVNYTPNPDVSGIDSFDYVVFNGVTEVGRATISITVGNVISEGQSPELEISDTLIDICLQTRTGELIDLCDAFSTATQSGVPEELQSLLDALAPKDTAAQTTMAYSIATQQAANVIKRLSALRHGVTGFSLGGLAFLEGSRTISGTELVGTLLNGATGGAASSDLGMSNKIGAFLSGHIRAGAQDVSINEDAFNFSAQALTGGLDYRFGSGGVIGLSTGLSSTEMDLPNNTGGLDVNAYNVSIYGSWYLNPGLYIDLVYGNNTQNFTKDRRIVFGSTNEVAYADTKSNLRALSIGGGFETRFGAGHLLTFTGRYDSINSIVDAYDEVGSSAYNLSINRRELKRQTSSIGAQYTSPISLSNAVLIPALDFAWVHQFQDNADSISGNFQADPNKTQFQFYSELPDQDYFKLGLGFSVIVPGGSTGFILWDTTLAKDYYSDYGLSAGYRMEF